MSARDDALAELLDREAILAVFRRYIDGIERKDAEQLRACFTDDAVIDYGFTTIRGRAEIDAYFGAPSSGGHPKYKIDRLVSIMQQVTNVWITFDGDRADVRSEGTSTHAGWRGEDPILILRQLRYEDVFRRGDDGWRIASRRHEPGWAVELPALEVGE